MVPDKFNMVDMGGIDLIMMQGESVPGLYDKLMAAISNCQYQCLYNWMFDSVLIPPTYVQMTVVNGEIYLNGGVSVTSDDVIHIYTIAPGPTPPAIIPLLAEENGTYNAPIGVDGFNPVTVDVPSYTPIIEPLSITENGTYTAPSGVDGYSPITVDVPETPPVIQSLSVNQNGTYIPPSGVDGYAPVVVNVSGGGGLTQFGYSDVTFTNTSTDSDIGDAQTDHITTALDSAAGAVSGTEQVIYSTQPVDLANVTFLICRVYSASFNSNSSGGMYIGVSQAIPTSYSSAFQSSYKRDIHGTYTNGVYVLDVSELSGQYYLFYASKVSFSNNGYAKANFELYTA